MSEPQPVESAENRQDTNPADQAESPTTKRSTDFKVYKPTDAAPQLPPPLPDEYFEPTAADLRDAQATLSARTQALVNAPLQSRAQREATDKAKRERWPYTRIRVRFPDRTQLEKVFPSTDRIKSVYAFVRELLRDDVKPIKFILYQSPPRRELKVSDPNVRGLTLVELQLAPSSVLLLQFEDESLNHAYTTAPLIPEVLQRAEDLPRPPELTSEPARSDQSKKQSASSSKPPGTGEKKIPKWLKLGKK